jgi:hypothetical protein
MNKSELEALLEELDEALAKAFPGPETIKALVVGGACLMFTDVTSRPTKDIDIIIWDLMGTDESSLIFKTPVATKIRRIISNIGKQHGLKGDEKMFLNDDCAPFLLELSDNELPEMRLFKMYKKIHLYIPNDLQYILACKLMAGRADKDFSDIEALCRLLGVQVRAQAQEVVDRFFPSRVDQRTYLLPTTLETFFGN